MSIYIQEALERLKQLEETILVEGKNLEKTFDKYQNSLKALPEDKRLLFDMLIELDPTYQKGSETTGAYGEWILNQYIKGNVLTTEEGAELSTALREFEANKKYIQNKDINSYKTVYELISAVNNSQPTIKQIKRQQKNAKSNKDIKLLYQDDDWVVYTPLTYAGSIYLGKGTAWCTAAQSVNGLMKYACHTGDEEAIADENILRLGYDEDDIQYIWDEFSRYAPDDFGPLYVIINKHDHAKKYQFHQESDQYKDDENDPIDYDMFLYKNSGLMDFFINECGYPEIEDSEVVAQLTREPKHLDVGELKVEDITLLSANEFSELPMKVCRFPSCEEPFWWLKSTVTFQYGDPEIGAVSCLNGSYVSAYRERTGDVRPAIIVSNLDSFDIPLYSPVELKNNTRYTSSWIKISNNMLLCNDYTFGSYIFDNESDDYETSEIREYIHSKAKELNII